jgi:hypothetical protein
MSEVGAVNFRNNALSMVKPIELAGADGKRSAFAFVGPGSSAAPGTFTTDFNYINFGRYHKAYYDSSVGWWRVPSETSIEWWSPEYPYVWGDEYDSSHYALRMGESFEDSKGEMVTTTFRIDHINSGGTLRVEYRKASDNSLVLKYECDVISPSSCGYWYWTWCGWYTYVGKGFNHEGCSQSSPCVYTYTYDNPCQYGLIRDRLYYYEDEIDSIGDYYVVITSPWTATKTINFKITNPVTPNAWITISEVLPYAAAGLGIVLLAIAFRRF